MEEFTNYLLGCKDKYDDEKKITDEANDSLEKQVKTKEETAQKRIINKLTKDRNPEIKELNLKEEDQKGANEDFASKLRQELEKTNLLEDERLTLLEKQRLGTAELKKLNEAILIQETSLGTLKIDNDGLGKAVDAQQKIISEERKTNQKEQDKNNVYKKNHAALKAKLDFIEKNYDYSSQPKAMRLEDFKDLINSNNSVNGAVEVFQTHLALCQKEIQEIETRKDMMKQF